MKKLIIFAIFGLLYSCEDVIDVELNESEPRLVIEASINWIKNTDGKEQEIKLSLSSPFFSDGIIPANNANVSIIDELGTEFIFLEDSSSGIYKTDSFSPVLGRTYFLIILYEGEVYRSEEQFIPVVPIDFIEQENDGGFSGEDIEVKAYYTDPAGVENYYFFEFLEESTSIPDLEIYEDEFTDGNQIFGFYSSDEIETDDALRIRIHGVSERFYEFMFILLQQGGDDGGGPFETQPATVRGNCINETDPDNFPYGFFRLSEVDEVNYIIE